MLKVLFDFEIDEKLERTHSPQYYQTIRSFFLHHLTLFELEIGLYVAKDDFALFIVCVTETELKAIPINIPEHLAIKIQSSITPQKFDTLFETLSTIDEEDNHLY